MSQVLKLTLVATLATCLHSVGAAQLILHPTPLTLADNLPIVQTPAYANFTDARCDRDGAIYMRHESAGDASWELARVSPDGTVKPTELAAVPGLGDTHTFAMATSDGGAVHELVRAWDQDNGTDSPAIYYLYFDSDGSFRSREKLANEFIPAVLVPLPSNGFFAAGVVMRKQPGAEDVEERPLAGIFDSDAHLIEKLGSSSSRTAVNGIAASPDDDSEIVNDALQLGGHVALGDDSNLYVLLSAGDTRVRVYRQTGEFLREMTLKQPFQEGLATGVWVSGGRLLVTYEGEADDPKDAVTYIEYDAGTGELIRAYRPQFKGTVACFQDGQTVTLMVRQQYSGQLAIGSVELR